jgi:hypothetical protein
MSYYAVPFTFNFQVSKIDIDLGATDVDCQDLYDACKLAQASEEGILYDPIAIGSGLSVLGPGVQVGLTVKLLGNWQLQFPPGDYNVGRVAGGNLVGGPGDDPIAYTPGIQILLIQSAASTVVVTGGSSLTPQESAKLMALDTAAVRADLAVVNRGVQNASLLIPHGENLP